MSETAHTAAGDHAGTGTAETKPIRDFTLRSAFALAFSDVSPIVGIYSVLAISLIAAGPAGAGDRLARDWLGPEPAGETSRGLRPAGKSRPPTRRAPITPSVSPVTPQRPGPVILETSRCWSTPNPPRSL